MVLTMRLFQSPRSGKFVSNLNRNNVEYAPHEEMFQSPRSGKFVSNDKLIDITEEDFSKHVSIP